MNILITGFEEFANYKINPAKLLLKEFSNYHTLLLPVSYNKAPIILKEAIAKIKPDYIISLGLADKREKISLELIGINYLNSSTPDNDGIIIEGKKINDCGPDGIITKLDANKLVKILNEANIPAYLSLSAGAYLCNLIYYLCLTYTKKSLFIHLPNLNNSDLTKDIKALKLIINELK